MLRSDRRSADWTLGFTTGQTRLCTGNCFIKTGSKLHGRRHDKYQVMSEDNKSCQYSNSVQQIMLKWCRNRNWIIFDEILMTHKNDQEKFSKSNNCAVFIGLCHRDTTFALFSSQTNKGTLLILLVIWYFYSIQVKAYLQSELFCRDSVTLRRFWLCLFPRQDFKWNPWLLMVFTIIQAKKQSSTVLDLICTSQ